MPRAVRERQIYDAAVRTFARRGYRAASMDEIAEVAGASKPLVYLYLHSKEELFGAVIKREAAALVKAVRAAVEPGACADRQLWSGLKGFFAHTAEHPDAWSVLHQQARMQGEPFAREVAAMRTEIAEFVTDLIGAAAREAGCGAGLAEREVSGLAHALVGAAESLADWANVRAQEGGWAGPDQEGDGAEQEGDGTEQGVAGERDAAAEKERAARETAATLMNFAWAGLGRLMNGERWTPDK
ncbi:TetR/AcrR family transcriptional regulator [Streptomyces sp. MST-110588]|uniref:TetR/AcrR family transcriptional regulator n=1 Tax=Streptomyces sp. MST-110588 TaxID=2833628 RepID=UPI001F5C7A11|nr:TetR/AcrR family transcriptional regulator [Streptomyces sp. MST-110588]UNO44027.1 TetR/AcrR family transcriptional regulator [Streptomyces sp. MST-110588]